MIQEIGALAGAVWHVLDQNGETKLAKLKKEVNAEGSTFDWAIGWLAREDKIVMTREKRTIYVSLKGREARRAHAA